MPSWPSIKVGSPADVAPVVEMNDQVVRVRCSGRDYDVDDKVRVIAAYEAHNAVVRAGIVADWLLEFDVVEGGTVSATFLAYQFLRLRSRTSTIGSSSGNFACSTMIRESGTPVDLASVQKRFRDAMNADDRE